MKKLTLGLSVLAAIAAVGVIGPKVVGSAFESTVQQQISNLNDTAGYNAEILEFNSSWFSSSAKINVTLDLASANATADDQDLESISSTIDMTAQHGPFLLNDIATLGWLTLDTSISGDSISERITTTNNAPIYAFQNHMTLLGNHNFNDAIAQFDFDCTACESPIKITFEGYQGKGAVNGTEISYAGNGGDTVFYTSNGVLNVNGLVVDFLGDVPVDKLFSMGVYDSSGKLLVSEINYTLQKSEQESEDVFAIAGLEFFTKTELNEDTSLADMTIGYALDSFNAGEIKGNDFDIEFEILNFDSNFLTAYETFLNQVNEQASANAQPDVFEELQNSFLNTHVKALMMAEPKLNMTKFNGTLSQGSFTGEMTSQFTEMNEMLVSLEDARFWMSHLVADAKLSGDKQLIVYLSQIMIENQIRKNPQAKGLPPEQIKEIAIAQSGQVLRSLIQQGLIVELESSYESVITFKDMNLKVNEMAIPLPM